MLITVSFHLKKELLMSANKFGMIYETSSPVHLVVYNSFKTVSEYLNYLTPRRFKNNRYKCVLSKTLVSYVRIIKK